MRLVSVKASLQREDECIAKILGRDDRVEEAAGGGVFGVEFTVMSNCATVNALFRPIQVF